MSIFSARPANAAGKRYVSLTYGFASTPPEEWAMGKKNGSAFSAVYGQHASKAFAWELTGQYATFGAVSSNDAGVTNSIAQSKFLVTGGGRFFFARYLNLHAGAGLGVVNLQQTNTAVSEEGMSSFGPPGLVILYGGGIQIPLSERMDLLGDYTMIGSGMQMTQINIGFRIRLY